MPPADSRMSLMWPTLWAGRAGSPCDPGQVLGPAPRLLAPFNYETPPLEASRSGLAAPCCGTRGGGGGQRPGMSMLPELIRE